MPNRTANYAAFYVDEPFHDSGNLGPNNLGPNIAPDFRYYNILRAWKAQDSSFPFIDAHAKTYNVRDGSEWRTLQQRLHARLSMSKNIVLFLSTNTKNSDALCEEIDYGINVKGLPVIVIYPDYKEISDISQVKKLWDKLPVFRDNMYKVATLHVPLKESLIREALSNNDFTVQHKIMADVYWYPNWY